MGAIPEVSLRQPPPSRSIIPTQATPAKDIHNRRTPTSSSATFLTKTSTTPTTPSRIVDLDLRGQTPGTAIVLSDDDDDGPGLTYSTQPASTSIHSQNASRSSVLPTSHSKSWTSASQPLSTMAALEFESQTAGPSTTSHAVDLPMSSITVDQTASSTPFKQSSTDPSSRRVPRKSAPSVYWDRNASPSDLFKKEKKRKKKEKKMKKLAARNFEMSELQGAPAALASTSSSSTHSRSTSAAVGTSACSHTSSSASSTSSLARQASSERKSQVNSTRPGPRWETIDQAERLQCLTHDIETVEHAAASTLKAATLDSTLDPLQSELKRSLSSSSQPIDSRSAAILIDEDDVQDGPSKTPNVSADSLPAQPFPRQESVSSRKSESRKSEPRTRDLSGTPSSSFPKGPEVHSKESADTTIMVPNGKPSAQLEAMAKPPALSAKALGKQPVARTSTPSSSSASLKRALESPDPSNRALKRSNPVISNNVTVSPTAGIPLGQGVAVPNLRSIAAAEARLLSPANADPPIPEPQVSWSSLTNIAKHSIDGVTNVPKKSARKTTGYEKVDSARLGSAANNGSAPVSSTVNKSQSNQAGPSMVDKVPGSTLPRPSGKSTPDSTASSKEMAYHAEAPDWEKRTMRPVTCSWKECDALLGSVGLLHKHLTVRHLKTQRPRTDSDSVASQSLVTKRRSSTPVNGGKKGASKRWREYSPVGFQYYCRFGSCTRKYVTYEQLEHHVTEYHINMMTSLAETGTHKSSGKTGQAKRNAKTETLAYLNPESPDSWVPTWDPRDNPEPVVMETIEPVAWDQVETHALRMLKANPSVPVWKTSTTPIVQPGRAMDEARLMNKLNAYHRRIRARNSPDSLIPHSVQMGFANRGNMGDPWACLPNMYASGNYSSSSVLHDIVPEANHYFRHPANDPSNSKTYHRLQLCKVMSSQEALDGYGLPLRIDGRDRELRVEALKTQKLEPPKKNAERLLTLTESDLKDPKMGVKVIQNKQDNKMGLERMVPTVPTIGLQRFLEIEENSARQVRGRKSQRLKR